MLDIFNYGAMMRDRTSDIRSDLILSGKKEFLKHGFEKASLRKICANAHVTTGAFYAQFDKKEDLFVALVEPVLAEYKSMYDEIIKNTLIDVSSHSENEIRSVSFIYRNREEFKLLFDCSSGTRYAGFREHLLEDTIQPSYQQCFDFYAGRAVDPAIVKVFVSIKFTQYMNLIYGDYSLDQILKLTELFSLFTSDGFVRLIRELKNDSYESLAEPSKAF